MCVYSILNSQKNLCPTPGPGLELSASSSSQLCSYLILLPLLSSDALFARSLIFLISSSSSAAVIFDVSLVSVSIVLAPILLLLLASGATANGSGVLRGVYWRAGVGESPVVERVMVLMVFKDEIVDGTERTDIFELDPERDMSVGRNSWPLATSSGSGGMGGSWG